MREYLSKKINPKGFTLIELLITVAILAILAVVAVAVYANTQASARDARRRADIDSIISSADAAKAAANTPMYPLIDGTSFSAGVVPTDPSSTQVYCYETSAATPPTFTMNPTAATPWGVACVGVSGNNVTATTSIPADTVTGIKFCAWLETTTPPGPFCKVGTVR